MSGIKFDHYASEAKEAARNSIMDSHRPIEYVQRDCDNGDGPFPYSGDHLDQQGIMK